MINLFEEIKKSQYLFPSTIEEIDQMTGDEFEDFLFWYYKKANYKVVKTTKTNDLGIDLIVSFLNEDTGEYQNIGIQAKRWSSKIPKEEIVKMLEAKDYYKLDYLFLITTSKVTSEANLFANNHEILIKDRLTIETMLKELEKLPNITFRENKLSNINKNNIDIDIFNKLKLYRSEKAKLKRKPAYMIFTDKTLQELSIYKPKTFKDLAKINGLGEKKINFYGEDILRIINE